MTLETNGPIKSFGREMTIFMPLLCAWQARREPSLGADDAKLKDG